MSRLRRPFLYDRYIFLTVDLLRSRARLKDIDFERLARALARMRRKQGFLLTAWVFLPDHWHGIIYPMNPVRRGLVKSPEECRWSSVHEDAGVSAEEQEQSAGCELTASVCPPMRRRGFEKAADLGRQVCATLAPKEERARGED